MQSRDESGEKNPPEMTLQQMLAAFDPTKHGGESMAGDAVGVEAFADHAQEGMA